MNRIEATDSPAEAEPAHILRTESWLSFFPLDPFRISEFTNVHARGKKKASLERSRGKSENRNLDNKVQLQKGAHLVWAKHYCSRMMYLQVTSVDIFYVPAGMFFVVPCSRYCSFITR